MGKTLDALLELVEIARKLLKENDDVRNFQSTYDIEAYDTKGIQERYRDAVKARADTLYQYGQAIRKFYSALTPNVSVEHNGITFAANPNKVEIVATKNRDYSQKAVLTEGGSCVFELVYMMK